ELNARYPPDLAQPTGLGAVLRSGEPVVYPEITDEMIAASAQDAEHLRLIRGIGMRSALLVPMRVGERTTGVISLVTAGRGLGSGGMGTVGVAGHPLPLRAPAAGGAMAIGRHGLLLGAVEEASWTEAPARLVPGDTLVFYTDGVTDTEGAEGRFGEERLARV